MPSPATLRAARPRRRRSAALALAALALTTVLPATAASADVTRTEDGPGFGSDVLVDDARGRVLVSGGPDQSHLEVYGRDGRLVSRVGELPGASALVLAPDGAHVYALLNATSQIAVLDASSLAEQRRLPVPGHVPSGLALAGGRLWTTTAVDHTSYVEQQVVGIDPATGQSVRLEHDLLHVSLIASAPGGGVLALGAGDISPPSLATYDVSGDLPRLLAERLLGGNPWRQLAVTPDDAVVHVATYDFEVRSYATADLAERQPLAPAAAGQSVAAEGPAGLATAGGGVLQLRDAGTGSVRASSPLDGRTTAGSLAVGRSGTLAAALVDRTAVFRRYDSAPFALHVLSTDDRRSPTTTGLPAGPTFGAEPAPDVVLRGRLATAGAGGAPLADRLLTVRRHGPGGTVLLERLRSAEDGSFSTSIDSPRSPGDYRYSVDYEGDASTAPTTGLHRHHVRRSVRRVDLAALGGDVVDDGERLFVSVPGSGEVLRTTPAGEVQARASGLPGVAALALGDRHLFAVSPERAELVALDPGTLAVAGRYGLADGACPDDVTAVGARAVVHTACAGEWTASGLVLVDPLLPGLTQRIASGEPSVELASSGSRVAAVSSAGHSDCCGTAVYETSTGRLQEIARSPLGRQAVSWAGQTLYAGDLRLDPQTLQPLDRIGRGVALSAVSPDGRSVLGVVDGTATVYDAATQRRTTVATAGGITGLQLRGDRASLISDGRLATVDLRPLRSTAVSVAGPPEARTGQPATVTGRLTDGSGQPLSGRPVRVGLGAADTLRLDDGVQVRTAADGTFRAEVTPSGTRSGVWRARYEGDQDALPAAASAPVTVGAPSSPAPAPTEPAPTEPAPSSPGYSGVGPRPIDPACPTRVPEDGFTDVPQDNAHERAVDCLVWWGVARGRTSTEYAPGATVTRAQMATFIAQLVLRSGGQLPAAGEDVFDDDDGSPHEDAVNRLARAGIVSGRADGSYGPDLPVTRDAMAKFLVLAVEHRTGRALPPSSDRFTDDAGNTHEANINRAAAAGLTGGTTASTYAPKLPVRRDQMGSFLARSLALLVDEGVAAPPA